MDSAATAGDSALDGAAVLLALDGAAILLALDGAAVLLAIRSDDRFGKMEVLTATRRHKQRTRTSVKPPRTVLQQASS